MPSAVYSHKRTQPSKAFHRYPTSLYAMNYSDFLFTAEFPFKANLRTGYKVNMRIPVSISQSPGEVYSSVFTEELTKILQDSWAITRYRLPRNTELTWLTFNKSGTKRPKATHLIDRPVQRSWNERILNVQYKYLCLLRSVNTFIVIVLYL